MSDDDFMDLVKTIRGRYKAPRILYKSRSIKVAVCVRNTLVDFIVPFHRMDEAIDALTSLSIGTGYEQDLLDQLRHARQLYGDQIEGGNAPKGAQAGRRKAVIPIQYAAAWTYCLLGEWNRLRPEIQASLLNAQSNVKQLVRRWDSYPRAQQLSLITAFLVDRVFRKERIGELESPVENREKKHNPQSYYITYIHPRLSWVRGRLEQNPHLFDFAKAQAFCDVNPKSRVASNAYLRQIFDVLSKLKTNSAGGRGTIKS